MRSFLLLLSLSAIAVSVFAQSAPSEAPLMQADRDFNKATQEKRLDGWMEFMAEDVVLQNGPSVGKSAVRKNLEEQWANPKFQLTWEPTRGEMFPAGAMGYTTGRWTLTNVDEKGNTVTLHGNYLTVWRKQADGSWKVVWDGGASDPRPKA